ncbi:MAG: tetratricopeptide repeat protein [Bacteroidales bacterium]
MKNNKQDILKDAEKLVEHEKFTEALNLLDSFLNKVPEDEDLLLKKAFLLKQTQQFGKALNTLKKVLELHPDNKEAQNLHNMITDILRFQQVDIYASTNLSNDPWLDD